MALVGTWAGSGKKQVTASVLGFGHQKAPAEAEALDCLAGGWITTTLCPAFPFTGLVWLSALGLQAPRPGV